MTAQYQYIEMFITYFLMILSIAAIPVVFIALGMYWVDADPRGDLDLIEAQPDTYPNYGAPRDENAVLNHNGTGWEKVNVFKDEETGEVHGHTRTAEMEWDIDESVKFPEIELELYDPVD